MSRCVGDLWLQLRHRRIAKEGFRLDFQQLVIASSSAEVRIPRRPVVREVCVSRHLTTASPKMRLEDVPPPPNNTPRMLERQDAFLDLIDERIDEALGSLQDKLRVGLGGSTAVNIRDHHAASAFISSPPFDGRPEVRSGNSQPTIHLESHADPRQAVWHAAGLSGSGRSSGSGGSRGAKATAAHRDELARTPRQATPSITLRARMPRASGDATTPRLLDSVQQRKQRVPTLARQQGIDALSPPHAQTAREHRPRSTTPRPRQDHARSLERNSARGPGFTLSTNTTPRALSARSKPTAATVCL